MTQSDVRLVITEIDIEALSDDWDTLADAGRAFAEAHDRNRWALGDLGRKVAKRYGEDSMGKYAAEINIRPSTQYDYTRCSTFYNEEDRVAFPPLNWSHYRAALKARKHDIAMTWLARAADEGWSADELSALLDPEGGGNVPSQKLTEFSATFDHLEAIPDGNGGVKGYFAVFRTAEPITELPNDRVLTIKVYAVKEAEGNDDDAE